MTGELDIQAHLVKAANAEGMHAFKSNNRFLVGVADLSITHTVKSPYGKVCFQGTSYIEVKYVKTPSKKGVYQVGLTVPQRNFLRDNNQAGGCSGWLLVVALAKGVYECYPGYYDPATPKDQSIWTGPHNIKFTKGIGDLWPIREILQHIWMGSPHYGA